MPDFTISIEAPQLVAALQSLAAAISGQSLVSPQPVQQPQYAPPLQQPPVQQPAQQQYQQPPMQQGYPQSPQQDYTQPSQQQPQQPPVQQGYPQQSAVPTSAPGYTTDQLAVAATQLVDAGRREELVAVLREFNCEALTALSKDLYGAFATRLRTMGAKI